VTHDGLDFASIDDNRLDYPVLWQSFRFAFARAAFTWGSTCCADQTFAALRANRGDAALIGGYMILGWHVPVPPQVAKLIETVGDLGPGELVALDLEADSARSLGMTPATCLAMAEAAFDLLVARYGIDRVVVYTSARVWSDVFGDLPSRIGGALGWIKIPYPMAVRQKPRPDLCPQFPLGVAWIPPPWRAAGSPGVRICQYQGDALGVVGASSTVDLNRAVPLAVGSRGNGVAWLQDRLGVPVDDDFGPLTERALIQWQIAQGVPDSGVLDVATLARLVAA
jgi:hypothetical protein